jgi:ankyrin repeat protein
MLVRSLERQCGARAAHAAKCEDFEHPTEGYMVTGTTQLIRAALRNDLPRVLQLVQLGAPLDATDRDDTPYSALQWACREGRERVAEALLDGKYEGRGASIDLLSGDWTPLMLASWYGHEGVVRLLLARGARQELQDSGGMTALH